MGTTTASGPLLTRMLQWTLLAANNAGVSTGWMGLIDDGGNELAGGGYARQDGDPSLFTWANPTLTYNGPTRTWTNLPAVTVDRIGFWTLASGGTLTATIELDSPVVLTAGDDITLAAGDLTWTWTPAGELATIGDTDAHPRRAFDNSQALGGLNQQRLLDLVDSSGDPIVATNYATWDLGGEAGDEWTANTDGTAANVAEWAAWDLPVLTVAGWELTLGAPLALAGDVSPDITTASGDVLNIFAGAFTATLEGAP